MVGSRLLKKSYGIDRRAPRHALDRPRENLWKYLRSDGNKVNFSIMDEYLGDFPATRRIRKLANKLRRTGAELREMAESPDDGTRRIARLIIALGKPTEPAFFQKGISDNYSVIRSDTVRFAETGADRTRLYNQLIRLIREDPVARVRRAAGRRLRKSFADLYSIDYESLPQLSRMLLLDSLDGYAQIDKKCAETLLFSENPEIAFRAARKLFEWNILRRYFEAKSNEKLLMKAAELGVVDFLEHARINAGNRNLAGVLAERAGRDDLILLLSSATSSRQNEKITQDSKEIQQIVQELANCNPCEKAAVMAAISKFPMQEVKQAIEDTYPTLSSENCAEILIEIARRGRWIDWQDKITAATESESPDIRREAILTLRELKGESSAPDISPFLLDNVERVRIAAAQALALLPSSGFEQLAKYLAIEPEGKIRESIIEGIRRAGSASTLSCLIENPNLLSPDLIKEIFNQGIDEFGVKMLAQSENDIINKVIRLGGFHAGKSIFLAWEKLKSEEKVRLLRCIEKSDWAYSALAMLRKQTTDCGPFLKHLSRKEALKLFEKALHNETPEKRRFLKNRLLRRLR